MKKLSFFALFMISLNLLAASGGTIQFMGPSHEFKQINQNTLSIIGSPPQGLTNVVYLYDSSTLDVTKPHYEVKIENNEFNVSEIEIESNVAILKDQARNISVAVPVKQVKRNVLGGIDELIVSTDSSRTGRFFFKENNVDLGKKAMLKIIDENFRVTVSNLDHTEEGIFAYCKIADNSLLACHFTYRMVYTMKLTKK